MSSALALPPSPQASELAGDALSRLRQARSMRRAAEKVRLRVDDESVVVPREAVDLLVQVLANLAEGRGVTIVSAEAEFTTQEAADILNVSRPYLVRLLDEGRIPHRKVGTHRRIRARDLMAYRERDDASRHAAADELTRLAQEMDLT